MCEDEKLFNMTYRSVRELLRSPIAMSIRKTFCELYRDDELRFFKTATSVLAYMVARYIAFGELYVEGVSDPSVLEKIESELYVFFLDVTNGSWVAFKGAIS